MSKKVAIVCDWLTGIGGAERVVLELHRMYPEAPIYTSQYDPTAIDLFKDADVRTTSLQKLPKSLKKFLPLLRAWTFSHLDLSEYDLVISSSGAEAKAVKVRPDATHVCYCHAPTHYYWSRYNEYIEHPGFGLLDPLARIALKLLVGPMRKWDYRAAQKPNLLIANSSHTQTMIKKYYDREALVIHPPVDIARFKTIQEKVRQGYVTAGRQTPYKAIDLAIAACSQLNIPLTVVGNGPDHIKLTRIAGPKVSFITDASDEDVPSIFSSAELFIFPGLDDFGIVAVEALASGTPVLAYRAGGAFDYIIPGLNGEFFDQQTVESLKNAINKFDKNKFDKNKVSQSVEKFGPQNFRASVQSVLNKYLI